ncbi:hypothetical protein JCM10450v2_005704 [Rhodotorula kratochvilovae]
MPLPPAAFFDAPVSRTAAPPSSWDDDDGWEAAYERTEQPRSEQEKNARLWQDANAPLQPTYSIFPSSSAGRAVPPPAALDARTTNGPPKLTILKRPSPAAPPSIGAAASTCTADARAREKTLKEREREYAEARRRIYGEEPPTGAAALAKSVEKLSLASGARARSANGRASPARSASPATRSPGSSASGASTPSSSSRTRTTSAPRELAAGGVVRAPKGPNGESGGFGFGSAGGGGGGGGAEGKKGERRAGGARGRGR